MGSVMTRSFPGGTLELKPKKGNVLKTERSRGKSKCKGPGAGTGLVPVGYQKTILATERGC